MQSAKTRFSVCSTLQQIVAAESSVAAAMFAAMVQMPFAMLEIGILTWTLHGSMDSDEVAIATTWDPT